MNRGCDPDEIAATVSSRGLSELRAYWELDPFGVEWRQQGRVCAELWNVQKVEGPDFTPEMFRALPPDPVDEDDEDEEDESDNEEVTEAFFAARGIKKAEGL